MKKLLCVAGFLVLAAGLPLWGYDTSPATIQVVPEAIWAAATGGGTWVTEVQITNFGASAASIQVYFDTGTSGAPINLPGTIPSMNSVKYANILATIDSADPSATVYYGKAGGLWVLCLSAQNIQVHAQTVNANFGKTFPGLNLVSGNSALQGRPMIIQGLIRNASYRTSVGVYNVDVSVTYTLRFTIYNSAYAVVGSYFEKTVNPYTQISFNPFVQAGVTSGDYDNCWLYIEAITGSTGYGPVFYGSLANNYTNDTYALMAKQYGAGGTAAPAPPGRY